ncbi:FeoA family protein [Methanocaldococcus indicus]|uniref:FeoA family protein n=1 Tax=Methanocaldococcus indicus TaxID=213231 RepID=UPI003C6D45B7
MYPLAFAKEGEEVIIKKINAGYGAIHKLSSMGLNVGSRIRVVRNQSGPIIVNARGCNIAIGRGLAMKILVDKG